VNRSDSRDVQIFFCCVLILTAAFIGAAPAKLLVTAGAAAQGGSALIARIGPRPGLAQTIGIFHAAFVLLPAAVAFVAVGLPVLIGYLGRCVRSGWNRRELVLLGALSAAVAAVVGLGKSPATFLASVALVLALSAIGSWPLLRRYGSVVGYRVLALGGLMFFGLAYYEYRLLASGVDSRAVAPTLLVMGTVSLVAGLPAVTVGEAARGLGRLAVVALLWSATALWALVPFERALADSAASADWLELRTTVLLAIVLLSSEFVHQRRRRQSRTLAHR